MPTVFVWRGLRFFFYSNEGTEPPHVHVRGGGSELKVWLSDLSIARNGGFADKDVGAILDQVLAHRRELLDAWRSHFGR